MRSFHGRRRRRALALLLGAQVLVVPLTAAAQNAPPALTGAELHIEDPEWSRYPVIGGMRPVDPALTPREVVAFDCAIRPTGELGECRVEPGTDASAYLVDFAIGGLRYARLAPGTVARAAPGAHVVFELQFEPGMRIETSVRPEPPRALVTDPAWSRPPRTAFPAQARARGLAASLVGVSCGIDRDGTPVLCRILYEEHPEVGFGTAALEALASSKLAPPSVDHTASDARLLFWMPITAELR